MGGVNFQTLIEAAKAQYHTLRRKKFDRGHRSFVLSSGLVQLLPLLTAAIVARLYTPAAFGAYAVFYAIVAIISSCGSLALQNAILIEDDDDGARQVTLLALSIAFLTSLLSLLVFVFVPQGVLVGAFGPDASVILPWAGGTIWLTSGYTVLYSWFVRNGEFALLAKNKLVLGVSTVVIQISIGLFELEAAGFVIANAVGSGLAIALLAPRFWREVVARAQSFSIQSAREKFSKHRDLPIYTVPATLLNTFGAQLPELLINRFFGANLLGQYSLANRVINMPLSFLSVSLQDIFREQASKELRATGNCRKSFHTFFLISFAASIAIMVPIALFIPIVFPWLFGHQWDQSGSLVQAIVFLMAIRFVSSPLSYVWILRDRQKEDLLWQIGLVVISVGALFGVPYLIDNASLIQTLGLYSVAAGLWYAFCIFLSFRFAR
jgi:O-antigen/teichoic acid export membrane protein